MNVPGFTAEASLTKTVSKYRNNILLGRVGSNAVLPMRGVSAAPVMENFLGYFPWEKRVPCCYEFEGKPYCSYFYVPLWYVCEDINRGGPSCPYCHPPVFEPTF